MSNVIEHPSSSPLTAVTASSAATGGNPENWLVTPPPSEDGETGQLVAEVVTLVDELASAARRYNVVVTLTLTPAEGEPESA